MAPNDHFDQRGDRPDAVAPSERSFGITFACVFALLTGWSAYRNGFGFAAMLTLSAALAFLAGAYLAPRALRPLNIAWQKFGLLLHRVMNPLILGVLFFIAFTPMGLVMRLFGGDLLRLKRKQDVASYWISRAGEDVEPASMKNQF